MANGLSKCLQSMARVWLNVFSLIKGKSQSPGEYLCLANTSFSNDNIKACPFYYSPPLQPLLSRNSLKKKKSKPPAHFHTKSSKSPDSEWRSSFTFARFQGKCAIYAVLLNQKNLHSLKSKSHSVFLSIFHVPFRYKHSCQTRKIWLEPCCSLGQVNFFSWSPAESQSSTP